MKSAFIAVGVVATLVIALQTVVGQSMPATSRPVGATSRPTTGPASRPTTWPTSAPASIQKLVVDLDAADWETAERAVLMLSRTDRQGEDAINRAMESVVSDRFRQRAQKVLQAIYTARIKIGGTWEEQRWADMRRTQTVTITGDAKGAITIAPAPSAGNGQWEYSGATFDGKTLKFHLKTNPGYEFDTEVTLTKTGELVGKRTQTKGGESFDFTMKKIRD